MRRKTITILILLLLVAATGCQEAEAIKAPTVVPIETAELEERIRLMKIVQEELALTRSILMLKADIAKFRAPKAPPADKPKSE